jgi:hypothetical protein
MSAAANARDREHKERVRAAAPKLLEACVLAAYKLEWGRVDDAHLVLRDAIAATQPPPNPRRRR